MMFVLLSFTHAHLIGMRQGRKRISFLSKISQGRGKNDWIIAVTILGMDVPATTMSKKVLKLLYPHFDLSPGHAVRLIHHSGAQSGYDTKPSSPVHLLFLLWSISAFAVVLLMPMFNLPLRVNSFYSFDITSLSHLVTMQHKWKHGSVHWQNQMLFQHENALPCHQDAF